ncbi:hypothetical protein CRG98_021238 [Punica granatum]|uniref:Uncharacterized protein n=1 Tax=Punica granatum TaxID=22663 RepID=A0A2I0JR29_PUNGR|nr:hypothetical protein CRG98_021238 [Punica granatum]
MPTFLDGPPTTLSFPLDREITVQELFHRARSPPEPSSPSRLCANSNTDQGPLYCQEPPCLATTIAPTHPSSRATSKGPPCTSRELPEPSLAAVQPSSSKETEKLPCGYLQGSWHNLCHGIEVKEATTTRGDLRGRLGHFLLEEAEGSLGLSWAMVGSSSQI